MGSGLSKKHSVVVAKTVVVLVEVLVVMDSMVEPPLALEVLERLCWCFVQHLVAPAVPGWYVERVQ